MQTAETSVKDLKCPFCGKPLASDEYHKVLAKFGQKAKQEYEEREKANRADLAAKINSLNEQHKAELASLKEGHRLQVAAIRKDLQKSSKAQIDLLKNNYAKLSSENVRQFKNLESQLRREHDQELRKKEREFKKERQQIEKQASQRADSSVRGEVEKLAQKLKDADADHGRDIRDRDKELAALKEQQKDSEKKIKERAQAYANQEIEKYKEKLDEKDIQNSRLAQAVEKLSKQLAESQSELKGERGELDLYATLIEAFPNDLFRRQKRGQASGDIIHQIRVDSKALLEMPIVYDNKAAATVTKKDIDKALNYKKIHGTNYVLIVSKRLPKKHVKNGYFGQKDGVLLVHPTIVVEVCRQIRGGIIELNRVNESKKGRETKEARLFAYVSGREFMDKIESLSLTYQRMFDLQIKEEKDHSNLWKERKNLQNALRESYIQISSGIEGIVQTKPEEMEAPQRAA